MSFTRTRLDEDREDQVKIRLNKEEREDLEKWKRVIDCDRDSTAYKMALAWSMGDLEQRTRGKFRVKIIRKKH